MANATSRPGQLRMTVSSDDADVAAEVEVGVDHVERGRQAPVGARRTGHPDRIEHAGRAQAVGQVLDQTAAAEADVEALAPGQRMETASLRREGGRLAVAAAQDDERDGAAGGRNPHGVDVSDSSGIAGALQPWGRASFSGRTPC